MGVSISTPHALEEQDYIKRRGPGWKDGESLFAAVVEGDLDKVCSILQTTPAQVDINQRKEGGMTALHYAVDRGHIEVVKLLLEHGADKLAKDDDDQTPLMIAQICEHAEIEALLS